jgi:hypothetical protein
MPFLTVGLPVMIPLRSIEGVTAWPLREMPRVRITRPAGPPEVSGAVQARWDQLCAEYPRYFDGPILSVVTFDPDACEVLARRDRYLRLAVQPQVATGVQQLSVTGILTAHDASGRKHVLLGRRAPQTRIYGGMWELGPSGGVPAPPAGAEELGREWLMRHLADEVSEEVGLELRGGHAAAFARDHFAHSDDVNIECDLGLLEDVPRAQPANWEYTEVRWLPIDMVAHFDANNAAAIIRTTRAVFRVLGWVPDPV